MRNPFDNDDSERFMARPSLDPEEDARRLRRLLAMRPEYMDVSRMNNHEVRRQVACYRAEDKLPARNEHSAWQSARPNAQPLASGAVAKTVTEEKRYLLRVALTYDPALAISVNKIPPARFKWENEVTGPESRRSGEIKSGDPVFSDLRHREMLAGDYRLEFQNAALDARAVKQPRS